MKRGLMITFEGIDGCGKSTQIDMLKTALEADGRAVAVFREPGGTVLSERIRAILLDSDLHIEPFAEMLLFSAARSQLVAERIRPSLAAGEIVLCDRFYDSTTVYQGAGRGVADTEWLGAFHEHVTGGLMPDRTYLIEVSPEERERRLGTRAHDRMERAGRDFFDRVAAAYQRLAERESDRILRVDGGRPIDAVHADIVADIRQLIQTEAEARV